MLRTVFAIGIAGLIFAGGSGTTQAAPILPVPAAATVGLDNLTDVQWGRNCWRDRWGRVHCRGGGGWGLAGVLAGVLGLAGRGSPLLVGSLGPSALQVVISNLVT